MARPRTAAQIAGDEAEALVAERLEAQGWTILARNVHVGRGEIDLVAVDPGQPAPAQLVIVEVRARSSRRFGLAEETVDFRKRRRIRDATWTMVTAGTLPDGRLLPQLPLRFDIVVVEPAEPDPPRIRHHRGAF